MIYAVYGFIFGLLIPYISRRFEKFMPATLAYGLFRTVWPNQSVSREKKKKNPKYQKLMKSYQWRSLMYGLVVSALSYFAFLRFGSSSAGWYLSFIWILVLLAEIDYKMMLLPDILTFPLLLTGLCFALFHGVGMGVADSIIGATAGYILPVIASLFLVWKSKEVFGGGDIKLLSAIGAWMGLENLLFVIIASCVIFGVYALVRRKRVGAFGPAIVLAALIVAFL